MQPEQKDAAYLWDMLQAAKEIRQFIQGISFHHYESNIMLQRAIEREMEIIGEAARHVSDSFQKSHPEIP